MKQYILCMVWKRNKWMASNIKCYSNYMKQKKKLNYE